MALFSGAFNILMLAGPLYMLQIYDRVLASRSVSTLVGLSVFLAGALAFQGILDIVRNRVVVRAARVLDALLERAVHWTTIYLPLSGIRGSDTVHAVRELDQVRTFLTSTGPLAIVDMPWIPVFLGVCFLIHPLLGGMAAAGAVLLLTLTIMTQVANRRPTEALSHEAGARISLAEANRRNGETILAMGMVGALGTRWSAVNNRYLSAAQRSSDVVNLYGSASKVLRLMLQSSILGLGAYLVIGNELTPGAMIAASIMMARGLAPIETAIANWRGFSAAVQSIRRLRELLAEVKPPESTTLLPAPRESLDVRRLTLAPPGATRAILSNAEFSLTAGEAVAVLGPSGCGKTALARTLVGVWRPGRGTVRLDGATLDQWDAETRGRCIGYISQSIELFAGSVAENIARMDPAPDSGMVVKAAKAADAHDMILGLPDGYDTLIGEAGAMLSGGQRQRIALARALYGDPFLIVLDEPNSNLDQVGEAALAKAVKSAKRRGAIVVLIAHRSSIISVCDKVLLLADGTQQAFGPRDEILRVMRDRGQSRQRGLKIVRASTDAAP